MKPKGEKFLTQRELRAIIANPDKPEYLKKVAKKIMKDEAMLLEYMALRKARLNITKQEKSIEKKKKNLTGWKKWCRIFLPDEIPSDKIKN
jgi:hypothetical protein